MRPGELLGVAVAPGVEVLLRCVDVTETEACIVMTRWSGPRARPSRAAAVFEVQPLTHHAWRRPVLGGWVRVLPPEEVRAVGRVALRAGEAERVVHPRDWVTVEPKPAAMAERVLPLVSWKALLEQVVTQWRWEHDRAGLLAVEAAQSAGAAQRLAAALGARERAATRLQQRGVAALARRRFFGAWTGAVPREVQASAEALMREAVAALEGATPARAARRLATLMRAFNRLQGQCGYRWDSTDREDIVEAVALVARACGVDEDTFATRVDAVREF